MKKQDTQVKKNTTNYAPDSHKKFCNRCLKYNQGCPMNGKRHPSENCTV